tara:strand:+ start:207 stop:890 length:684 start_codon:yes stop_codon:yes gene_type:complete
MKKKIIGDINEKLDEIENNSIDLIFTSPPYWKGFEYESYFNSYLQYIEFCDTWIKKIKCKLKKNGFFLLNIANDAETSIKAFEILNICIKHYWKLCDTIIWNVYNRQPCNSNRRLTNQTEFIFLLRHSSNNMKINKNIDLEKYKNVFETKNIGNIWRIPFEINTKSKLCKELKSKWGHSGFPKLLCELILDLFSNENDLILDCFCGNFILADICEKKNRNIIGIDIN